MSKYQIEAERKAMEGTIVVGSKKGYAGRSAFDLEQMTKIIEMTNEERRRSSKITINCLVTPSFLVGSTREMNFAKKVHFLDILREEDILTNVSHRPPKLYSLKKDISQIVEII